MDYPEKEKTYEILGACFEVYNRMGAGFSEAEYQECLEIEFEFRGIPYTAQPTLPLRYRDRPLKSRFQPDFLCYETVIVEIKAVACIVDDFRSKVINYLNASKLRVGLLVNFGHHPKLEYERFVS